MSRYGSSVIHIILSISDWVNWLIVRVLGIMVIALFGITLYESFFRYALRNPLPWPVPVSRILLIWIALLGISVAFKAGEHVAVEGVVRALPMRYQKTILLFDYFIIGLWASVVVWQGWLTTSHATQMMTITRALQIQFKWRLMAVPVSAVIQLIHLLASPAIIQRTGEAKKGEK